MLVLLKNNNLEFKSKHLSESFNSICLQNHFFTPRDRVNSERDKHTLIVN